MRPTPAERPGEHCDHGLSYGTVSSYLSVLKHIRAKWGATRLNRVKPVAVQEWLKTLDAAPRQSASFVIAKT